MLKKLDLLVEAVEVLLESLSKEPLHWGTWQELVPLVTDRDMVGFGLGLCVILRQHDACNIWVATLKAKVTA